MQYAGECEKQGSYLQGTHFKCYGRAFVSVAYETTILYTHVVENPYGPAVKRIRCILQHFNVFCVLDYKPLSFLLFKEKSERA